MEHNSKTQNKPYQIQVTGDLPYYVPFPEEAILTPSLIGAEPFRLQLQHFVLKPSEEGMQVSGDDRLGTFIRSRIIFEYKSLEGPSEFNQAVLQKALEITNRFIDAVKYSTSDFSMRPIQQFDHYIISYSQEGTAEILKEGTTFGPFGITPIARITSEKVQSVYNLFNGIVSINSSRMLLLDAKYHSTIGDYNRAVLDIGTALETHIGWLINQYKTVFSEFYEISTDDKNCWEHYDEVLLAATGHTMREEEDLFVQLEFIRAIRNSVTHEWRPIFRMGPKFRTQYESRHRLRDGTEINTKEKADELIQSAQKILDYAEELFRLKYENKSP